MDENKQFKEFSVSLYGNLEKYNDVISKGRARIFYKYDNRNGSYITDEFAQKLIDSLAYVPVKGIYDNEDYTDHGYSRSLGRIYGIVPENPNFAWETHLDEDGVEREYACADVLIFTAIYPEASQVFGKSLSMEIYEKTLQGEWQFINGRKQFVFTDGCFLGLQILGDEVEPCFEGAAFFSLYESIAEWVKKIDDFNLNFQNREQGGKVMPTVDYRLSDNQKFEMIWNLLNPNYNETNNWDLDYQIIDVYDNYAIVLSCKEQQFKRAYYTKNDETDSLSIDSFEVCYIVDVNEKEKNALETIQALNGGTYECLDSNFTANSVVEEQKSEFELKIEELNNSISTLTAENEEISANYANAQTLLEEAKTNFENIQNSVAALEEERDTLANYKKNIETTKKQEIISSYDEVLSEEILTNYTNNLDNYSVEDLDKELAYEVKKSNPSVFSKEGGNPAYVPKDAPKSGLEAILSKYNK